MSKKERRSVPVLRFKGFTDDWEQRKWKDILLVNSGKDYKHLSRGSIPVYGTGGYMLSVNKELSNVDAIGIGRKGTIDHPQYLKAPFWTVDTLFFMTPKNDINIDFAFGISRTVNWKKYDDSTGLPSLSKKSIDNISIKLPNYDEQIKIGQMISQIDKVISLQQRKLDQLKQLKKAYLSDLFSIKNKPQIRFKGFKGKWKKSKLLDNVSNIIDFRGKTPKKLGMDWSDQGILALSALNVKDGFIDKSIHAHYGDIKLYNKWMAGNKLHKGQVLFTTEAPMGNVAQVPDNDKYILSQRTIAFNVNKDKISDFFLAMLLQTTTVHNQLLSLSSGGTAKGVSQKS